MNRAITLLSLAIVALAASITALAIANVVTAPVRDRMPHAIHNDGNPFNNYID